MKVVHVITRLIIGGAQENTLHTVEDQHRLHGDDVTLITGPPLGPEGSLMPRAEQGGFPLRVIPELRRSIHPWRDWASYRSLIRLLREIKPNLVHTHSSKAGILGRAAAEQLRIPAVHTVHGASFHYGQHPAIFRTYVHAERWVARRTAHFISVADAMTDEYVAAGVDQRDRFTTVYSGFDVEPFLTPPRPPAEVRTQWGLEDHHVVIGKIARLFHLKGHEFLLQAAPKIVAAHPHVRFLLVGDGILREQFEREIQSRDLSDHFIFTGLVPPAQIPELIHAMDIVAHTSQWEGLARVLPQALIAGKPVVTYDVGGAREVVIPGETGYLLPRDSVDELAAAVCELVGNASLRDRLGQTGRERFTNQFRHQSMTARIREVYGRVLSVPVQRRNMTRRRSGSAKGKSFWTSDLSQLFMSSKNPIALIEDLFAQDSYLCEQLAFPVEAVELPEIMPQNGQLLTVGFCLTGGALSKDRLRKVVAATIGILDRRFILKRFNRIAVSVWYQGDSRDAEKICYLEAKRGKLPNLRKHDLFSRELIDRNRDAFVGWPESPIVNRLLESK